MASIEDDLKEGSFRQQSTQDGASEENKGMKISYESYIIGSSSELQAAADSQLATDDSIKFAMGAAMSRANDTSHT